MPRYSSFPPDLPARREGLTYESGIATVTCDTCTRQVKIALHERTYERWLTCDQWTAQEAARTVLEHLDNKDKETLLSGRCSGCWWHAIKMPA